MILQHATSEKNDDRKISTARMKSKIEEITRSGTNIRKHEDTKRGKIRK